MTTDEEKTKLSKLLHGLEVQEIKLTERCFDLVKEFQHKFSKEVEEEEEAQMEGQTYENPYVVDKAFLEENERKLRELLFEGKRAKKNNTDSVLLTGPDPKRPWRTHSNKEKLLRIDSELKRHLEKSSQLIVPLAEGDMKDLVTECREETRVAPSVGADRLRNTVEAARKNLPNFQYRVVDNTTATAILPEAHVTPEVPKPATDENKILTS